MTSRGHIFLAALVVAAAVAGCGSDSGGSTASGTAAASARTVDTQQVEQGIEKSLSTSQVQVTSVDCPSDVPKKQGATFQCTVKLSNGGAGKVEVTQQGANRYTYSFVDGSVQIPGSWVDQQIEAELDKEGFPNATVECPSNIIVKTNSPVTCNVTGAGGGTTEVTFEFSSEDGTVDSSSVSSS